MATLNEMYGNVAHLENELKKDNRFVTEYQIGDLKARIAEEEAKLMAEKISGANENHVVRYVETPEEREARLAAAKEYKRQEALYDQLVELASKHPEVLDYWLYKIDYKYKKQVVGVSELVNSEPYKKFMKGVNELDGNFPLFNNIDYFVRKTGCAYYIDKLRKEDEENERIRKIENAKWEAAWQARMKKYKKEENKKLLKQLLPFIIFVVIPFLVVGTIVLIEVF